jgi:RHS repeat-associated protein
LNYRADGRLYQRTQGGTTKTYRYDNRWNAILEETGTSTNGYIFTPGSAQELLGKTYGTLSASFAAYTYKDNIGSVRRWRLYNKSSLQNIEFEPYGGVYTADNTTTPYDPIFALHPYDPAAQMYRAPYRMYDPDSARWTRRDPLGMVDGPNKYAYTKGRPAHYLDVFGLCGSSSVLPGEPSPDEGGDPKNGDCGTGDNAKDIPERIPIGSEYVDFGPCCGAHDDCYGCDGFQKHEDKESCDDTFENCMNDACDSKFPAGSPDNTLCKFTAWTYASAVMAKGQNAYDEGRKCCGTND